MFNKKFKYIHERISTLQTWVREVDMRIGRLNNTIAIVDDQYAAMRTIKADMEKMDVLTEMVSKLARRIDLAGIDKLPNECICEACGCKK